MDSCDCCGGLLGDYPVELKYRGKTSTFCSFGCAVLQVAPACPTCGAKVLGRGIIDSERTYCSPRCARGTTVEAALSAM
jgi:hypothetical protein